MIAEFIENETADVTAYQYDYGQKLEITGLDLQDSFEVHYESGRESPEIRKGTVDENSVGTVAVPDATLQLPYDVVKAWVYVKTPDSGTTVRTVNIHIIKRDKPSDSPSVDDYPQIKAYADYVKENAEKVACAEAVADKLKADSAAGLFNGADGPPGPSGIQGPPGQDGAPGENGKDGAQMYIATTEEELNAVFEQAMADFTVGYAFSIITTDYIMNGSGHSNDDLLQVYVLDSGTGSPDDALILMNYIIDESIYAFVKGLKPDKYNEYIKAYPMSTDFSADLSEQKVSKVRLTVKPDNLIVSGTGAHNIGLKFNKYTLSVFETQASAYDLGYLDIQAEILDSQFVIVHSRMYDAGGSLLKETELFTSVSVANPYITNIGLKFNGFQTSGKNYRIVYIAGGN